jgi:indole-3-glycerol phosphate synthase
VISEDFPYLDIAREYEAAGACAISVLTEPDFFQGSNRYLSEISQQVKVPLLRKDFTIDEYQIYEAKVIGADAVLLICALLDTDTIRHYVEICNNLGLSALVEANTAQEVESAVAADAKIIGVNNRNLKTFEVHLETCTALRPLVPDGVLFVAESGIQTAEDIAILRQAGVDAVLIGETLMRSNDKSTALQNLRGK